jgi:D-alanyl-D-alanine carboxypeptidase
MFDEAWARLDSFVAGAMAREGTPGVALALTDRNDTLHVATFGHADAAARKPVREDTLFEIGSIGKSFTAIALLGEVEARRLDLHAPVARYLPWFRVRSSFEPITAHHLLGHVAGIIEGRDFTGEAAYEVRGLHETEAAWPPGRRFHYSNLGFKALGLLLEKVSGRSYAEVITERVLEPLAMTATLPAISNSLRDRMAVGHEPMLDDRPWHPGLPLGPAPRVETATADGCIASSARDMAAYVRMLLNRGRDVLAPESWERLTQPGASDAEHGQSYGYGLALWEHDGRPRLGHGGWTVGFRCEMAADIEDGLGVVVLLNGPGPDLEITRHALALASAALRSEPLPDPVALETDLSAYEGTYSSPTEEVTVARDRNRLVLQRNGESMALVDRGDDYFVPDHPELGRYFVIFKRSHDAITGLVHGPDGYVAGSYPGPHDFEVPDHWRELVGHYRSHNPWYSNFRVVLRGEELVIIPGDGVEKTLTPVDERSFRLGDGPDQIVFEPPYGEPALRVRFLGGGDYYRTFTP